MAKKDDDVTTAPPALNKDDTPPAESEASGDITVGFAEGVTDGVATAGEPGVRLNVSVGLDTLTSISWGDGQTDIPPDTSGDFVAHIYREPGSALVVTVEDNTGASGSSDAFDVAMPEPAEPPTETVEEANEAGYLGSPPDPEPNESYTVAGVTAPPE